MKKKSIKICNKIAKNRYSILNETSSLKSWLYIQIRQIDNSFMFNLILYYYGKHKQQQRYGFCNSRTWFSSI